MAGSKFKVQPITLEETRNEAFFRLRQRIIKNLAYKDLSSDAKIAYALLWNRRNLSLANNWVMDGLVYVIYSRAELAGDLGCSERTAVKIMSELREYGLIDEKRLGMKKANLIFVGQATGNVLPDSSLLEVQDLHVQGSAKSASQEVQDLHPSKNYMNKNYKSKKSPLYPPSEGEGINNSDAIAKEPEDQTSEKEISSPVQDFPQSVADLWNEIMSHAPQVKVISKARRKSINARRKEIPEAKDLEWWRKYFETVRASKLNGRGTGRYEGQVVAFDTAIRPSVVLKVLEGVYSDTPVPESPYVDKALGWLKANYPKPESVDGNARQVLKSIMPIGTTEAEKDRVSQRLVDEIDRYCRTDEVRGGFIKSCANWLRSIDWQGGRS